jgi:hypothetical protein
MDNVSNWKSTHIYITIIIGNTALFEPLPSSENSSRFVYSFYELDHPVFTPLDFETIIQKKVVSLASNPKLGGTVSFIPSNINSHTS